MTVGAYATHEEVDATVLLDLVFEAGTFSSEISRVAIENIYVLLGYVDMAEEVVPHEAVIALGVVFGKANILVHVESDNILERHFTFFVKLDQTTVHAQRRAAGGATEYEGVLGSGVGFVDTGCNIVACPTGEAIVIRFNN